MKIKHKLLSDYQYVSPDKKIFLIKSGTIVEEYCYKLKGELIPLDKGIIDINPEIFELIDWKAELMSFMKANKMPQPSQLGKKLIPFFEEMVLSSIQQNTVTKNDISSRDIERKESEIYSLKKEVDRKEIDIENKEKRLNDREDDLEARLRRIEKRETEYKEDLKNLQKKEEDLRNRNKDISSKELDIQDKLNALNEKERNLDGNILSSAKEFDEKYAELQSKIEEDLDSLTKREKELEVESRRLKELEKTIESNMESLVQSDKSKIYEDLKIELKGIESDVNSIYNISKSINDAKISGGNWSNYTEQLFTSINKLKERIDNNLLY